MAAVALSVCTALTAARLPAAANTLPAVIREAQSKIVKIYGAGGFRALEPYQSHRS